MGIMLWQAPLDTELRLDDGVPEGLQRRLTSFGLRRGVEFRLVQRTAGGGRVAVVNGSRVALGASVLRDLRVEVLA